MRYSATAIFDDGSSRQDTTSAEGVWAETTIGASRKWYWKLTDDERARCARVVISAYIQTERFPWQAYAGPQVAFAPRERFREAEAPPVSAGQIGANGEVRLHRDG